MSSQPDFSVCSCLLSSYRDDPESTPLHPSLHAISISVFFLGNLTCRRPLLSLEHFCAIQDYWDGQNLDYPLVQSSCQCSGVPISLHCQSLNTLRSQNSFIIMWKYVSMQLFLLGHTSVPSNLEHLFQSLEVFQFPFLGYLKEVLFPLNFLWSYCNVSFSYLLIL